MADAGPPIVLMALGLILWLAVKATLAGISVQTIGLILFLVGVLWLVVELFQARATGPRRRTVVRCASATSTEAARPGSAPPARGERTVGVEHEAAVEAVVVRAARSSRCSRPDQPAGSRTTIRSRRVPGAASSRTSRCSRVPIASRSATSPGCVSTTSATRNSVAPRRRCEATASLSASSRAAWSGYGNAQATSSTSIAALATPASASASWRAVSVADLPEPGAPVITTANTAAERNPSPQGARDAPLAGEPSDARQVLFEH